MATWKEEETAKLIEIWSEDAIQAMVGEIGKFL